MKTKTSQQQRTKYTDQVSPFVNELRGLRAPGPLVEWAARRTEAEYVQECDRPDWMIWVMEKKQGSAGWPQGKKLALAVGGALAVSWVMTKLYLAKWGRLLALGVLKRTINVESKNN